MTKAVIRVVNHAVNRGMSELAARDCFVLVCRDAAEVEEAMELFRRWSRASVSETGK